MGQPVTVANENAAPDTPLKAGFSMPSRFDEHERTLVSWPPKEEGAHTDLESFRDEVAALVKAISAHESVTLLVDPADEEGARARCGHVASILVVPIDASWIRDCPSSYKLEHRAV
jgi:agmatine deiminase